jgi:hypothetical protein
LVIIEHLTQLVITFNEAQNIRRTLDKPVCTPRIVVGACAAWPLVAVAEEMEALYEVITDLAEATGFRTLSSICEGFQPKTSFLSCFYA